MNCGARNGEAAYRFIASNLFLAAFLFSSIALATAPQEAPAFGVTVGSVSAPANSVASVAVSSTALGASVSTLALKLAYDPSALTPLAATADTAALSAGKSLQFNALEGILTIVFFGGAASIPEGALVEILFETSGGGVPGTSLPLTDAGSSAADPDAEEVPLDVTAGEVTLIAQPGRHSADSQPDWRITLSELLRIVQFFNLDTYHCQADTEDGYAPQPGDQACPPHSSDYLPQDWSVDLTELLRLIQFYNSPKRAYHADPAGEDNFAPGPFE